jgi:hypothetical protein
MKYIYGTIIQYEYIMKIFKMKIELKISGYGQNYFVRKTAKGN